MSGERNERLYTEQEIHQIIHIINEISQAEQEGRLWQLLCDIQTAISMSGLIDIVEDQKTQTNQLLEEFMERKTAGENFRYLSSDEITSLAIEIHTTGTCLETKR